MEHTSKALLTSIFLLTAAHAAADSSIESTFRLTLDKKAGSGLCPAYFDVVETTRFYEGGFEAGATAWLQWMAAPFSFVESKDKSVTWGAELNSTYRHCRAHARVASVNGFPVEGDFHIRARFTAGYIYFTLDVSPYGEMTAITYQNIIRHNPSYRWADAD